MPNSQDSLEQRFDEFIEATNKKIEELGVMIVKLQTELQSAKAMKKDIVNISNLEVRGSLGATVKTIGDIVK